ncbi:MAG: glycosyltransferase [Gammaproteobacteria bacterium]
MESARVFIGFDSREPVAYHVLVNSIVRRASIPVSFTPLVLAHLRRIFDRPRDPSQATEFAFSRFLVPYLSGYEGWSVFMDCDMLFLDDVARLWALRDERYAVMVVKHEYEPSTSRKLFGDRQTAYAKKNWSSLILFNTPLCRTLSPQYLRTASGLALHQFQWLEREELIGALPGPWNFLVGEYPRVSGQSNLHFTLGGPYIAGHDKGDFADAWFAEYALATSCDGRVVALPQATGAGAPESAGRGER